MMPLYGLIVHPYELERVFELKEHTYTYTHTQTHTHAHAHEPRKRKKERKSGPVALREWNKRVVLLISEQASNKIVCWPSIMHSQHETISI